MKTKLFVLMLSAFVIFLTACEKYPPIVADKQPTADFNFSGNEIDSAYATVRFANTSTDATTYLWTLPGSDVGSSTDKNPTVMYSTAGTYDVTLECANDNGTAKKSSTITITDGRGAINIIVKDQSSSLDLYCMDVYLFNQVYEQQFVTNDTCLLLVPKKYKGLQANNNNFSVKLHFINGNSATLTPFNYFTIGSAAYPGTVIFSF